MLPELTFAGCAAPGQQVDPQLDGLPAGTLGVLALAPQAGLLPLGGGCDLLLDPLTTQQFLAPTAAWALPVPATLLAQTVFVQGFGVEVLPAGAFLSASSGLELTLSTALGTGL